MNKKPQTMTLIESKNPHVLAVPFPAQGHVKPLFKFALKLAKHGVKVTFVNIQPIHEKLVELLDQQNNNDDNNNDNFVLTSIPHGLSQDEDPDDVIKMLDTLRRTMPGILIDLVKRINSCNQRITCLLADTTIGWIFEIAEKLGVKPAGFMPASAATLALVNHIPELLRQQILDHDGNLSEGKVVSLSSGIPTWRKDEPSWSAPTDPRTQKIFFETSIAIQKPIHLAELLMGNTCQELEPSACAMSPKLLPIGPLLDPKTDTHSCSFFQEDDSCLKFLDTKPIGSVIYVSFGSLAVLSQEQLEELALGLELSNRPFLWVARPDLANGSRVVYPDGFLDRVRDVGKIVEWAPQEKILSHASIGCFLSHCGWNSTLEGASFGVPFLCWPYFAEQFHNLKYICDMWEMGLRIESDENGIKTRDEIGAKISMLLSDEKIKGNALKVKEICAKSVGENGSCSKNFETFIDFLKK